MSFLGSDARPPLFSRGGETAQGDHVSPGRETTQPADVFVLHVHRGSEPVSEMNSSLLWNGGAWSEAALALKGTLSGLPRPTPWGAMTEADGWRAPRTLDEARTKLTQNAGKFLINYTYIVCASAIACVCFTPLAAVAVLLAGVASAWVLFDTRRVGVTVMKGVSRIQRQVLSAAIFSSVTVMSGAWGAACTGAVVGACACATHGLLFEPPVDFKG